MKKPRLTDSDRLAIETGLRSGKTVYSIAKELSRPVTTVTREIRARAVESDKGAACTEPTPFDGLAQGDVSLMMPHVNSYVRKGLGDKTPYDLFTAEQGDETASLFGMSRIAANDVILRPSLLGIEVKVKEGVSRKDGETPEKR